MPQGACCARKRPAKHGPGENLKIRSNDDRDFIPKMTLLRTFEVFCELGMCGKMPKSQNLKLKINT